MRAVDTNVLVRLITRDEEAQLADALSYVAPGAWVSHLVLAEAIWVLSYTYRVPHSQLVGAIEVILEHDQLVVQEPDVARAALKLFCKQSRLGFSDCLVLEIARKAGHLPLGTFDRSLSKQEGAERV